MTAACQSALNFDPRSASKIDPFGDRALTAALAPAKLVRVAQPGRARISKEPFLEAQARFLNRQLSLPVSTISQWWVRRSSSAVVIFGSPNTLGHSPKARLVVTTIEVRS
jgi:hypothetical protein